MNPAFDPAAGPRSSAQILRERAVALARPPAPVDTAGRIEVLEFRLAHEHYAVETRWVREALPFENLTPLPGTPPFMRGIVNARGRILPVFDLKQFFDLPGHGLTDLHAIIRVEGRGVELGLLVDAVIGVGALPLGDLQPSLPTLAGIRADYLKGVTARHLVVLDLDRVLSDPRLVVDDGLNPAPST